MNLELYHYKNKSNFVSDYNLSDLTFRNKSIAFISDTNQVFTHDKLFGGKYTFSGAATTSQNGKLIINKPNDSKTESSSTIQETINLFKGPVGSSNKPIYINSNGVISECNEIPSIDNKQDKLTLSTTTNLQSGVYHKITPTSDITITLVNTTDVIPEYLGEIVFNDTVYNITWPDNIIWDDDPIYQVNCTYAFSILNGLGVIREFIRS